MSWWGCICFAEAAICAAQLADALSPSRAAAVVLLPHILFVQQGASELIWGSLHKGYVYQCIWCGLFGGISDVPC